MARKKEKMYEVKQGQQEKKRKPKGDEKQMTRSPSQMKINKKNRTKGQSKGNRQVKSAKVRNKQKLTSSLSK